MSAAKDNLPNEEAVCGYPSSKSDYDHDAERRAYAGGRCLRQPARMLPLFCFTVAGRPGTPGALPVSSWRSPAGTRCRLTFAATVRAAAYLPHLPRPRNLKGLRKNLREVNGRFYWHWDPAFLRSPADQAVQRDPLVDPARLGAAAMSLRVPTLLLRGGESDVLSPEDARRFLELVPHAEFCDIAGAHHMVAGDDNRVFDTVLGDFLERRVQSRLNLFRPD